MEILTANPIMTKILVIFGILMIGLIAFNVVQFGRGLFAFVSMKVKYKKIFKEKKKEVEEMKARGEHHEWMFINLFGQEVNVCKKTGYCPKLNCFMNEDALKGQAEADDMKKRYNIFKGEKLLSISDRYDIGKNDLDMLINDLKSMEDEFFLTEIGAKDE